MPDNPDVNTLLRRARGAKAAQDKLKASMAAVAAQAKSPPQGPAGQGSKQ